MNKWITFFSQTGSEIVDLANCLYRWPDVIITNNTDLDSIHPRIRNKITHTLNKEDAKTLHVLRSVAKPGDLITLHGWLRIVPRDICEQYNIYNGHPGLINKHPELKGKDPQQRAFENIHRYSKIGSVVHKVTPKVDDGEIISSCSVNTPEKVTLEKMFNSLKLTSRESWLVFLKEHIKMKEAVC